MSTQALTTSRSLALHPSHFRPASLALVGTFPPTPCGLATFAAALGKGLEEVGVDRLGVVRSTTDETLPWDERVVSILRPGSPASRSTAARALNEFDAVLIQHEYGIYGGESGSEILDLLTDLAVPSIITLHTVPSDPTDSQRHVLETLVAMGAHAVTMTEAARRRLVGNYDVDPDKVVVIPHGATIVHRTNTPEPDVFTLLTWGLLGPGKGIEWVIDSMALIKDELPHVRYVVAGQTHPKVFEREGDRYRMELPTGCCSTPSTEHSGISGSWLPTHQLSFFPTTAPIKSPLAYSSMHWLPADRSSLPNSLMPPNWWETAPDYWCHIAAQRHWPRPSAMWSPTSQTFGPWKHKHG
jgi:hypothetical protein